jgi:hypothetical protein
MSARRAELLAQAARDRARIAAAFAPLAGPLQLADRGLSLLSWLRQRPLVVAAATAAMIWLGRRRGTRRVNLAQLALGAWQVGRVVAGILAARRARP